MDIVLYFKFECGYLACFRLFYRVYCLEWGFIICLCIIGAGIRGDGCNDCLIAAYISILTN